MSGGRDTVSVCIIAQDCEHIIRRCLDSCTWADEIVFVDGGSTDATIDIAREYSSVIYERPFDYDAHQHNYAIARANSDWTFVLDSDEVIPPELAEEVHQLIGSSPPSYNVYKVPRKLIDHGRWLRCCGTYPDYQVRFFCTGHFVYALDRVHPRGILKEPCGLLHNAILHYSFDDLADHIDRINRWSTMSALDYYHQGKRPSGLYLFVRFWVTFWHEYVLRSGIRDGIAGLMYSVVRAAESFTKYAKVWEMANGTSAMDLEGELARKRAADRDLLADERQPDLLRAAADDAAER